MLKKLELSKVVSDFYRDDAELCGIIGPFGSGKSVGCIAKTIKLAMEQAPDDNGIRRTRFAFVRNTYAQLMETTKASWDQWVPTHVPNGEGDMVAVNYYKDAQKKFFLGIDRPLNKGGRYTMKLPDGTYVYSEILFKALDHEKDIRNLLSLELTGAWINEFREIRFDVISNLMGRTGRYPEQSSGTGATWAGIFMDSNPPNVGGKYFKLFEGDEVDDDLVALAEEAGVKAPTVRLHKQPSGLSADAENIPNLKGGRQYYINMMATAKAEGKDTNWVNIHVHGKYGILSHGQAIYANQFNSDLHISKSEIRPIKHKVIGIGMDFGLTPAAVFGQMDAQGRWIMLREIVTDIQEQKGMLQFIQHMIPRMNDWFGTDAVYMIYGDPAGNQRSQTDMKTCFQVLRGSGFTVLASEQSPSLRIDSVRATLNRMIDGQPAFIMDPRCVIMKQGFQGGYQYRRLQTSQERYDESPEKNEYSHPHDAWQYLVAHFEGTVVRGGHQRRWPADGALARNLSKMKQQKPASTGKWSAWG